VTTFATVVALAAGVPPAACIVLAGAALTGQLSVGWSNDWVDAARDRAVARPDKPVAVGLVSVAAVRRAALTAAALCVPLSLALGWRAGALHLTAVGSAWAYNAGLKSSWWSWAPYAFAFAALPSVATLALPGHPVAPAWAAGAGALLGVGAHLANVAPDLDDDRATGVNGLAHRLGRTGTGLLAALLLLAATVLVVLGPAGAPAPWAWAGLLLAAGLTAVGAAVTLLAPTSRLPFVASLAVAAVDVALLVVAGSRLV
jgi:4-hydroxybenzoate polyprenyltransferase